MCLAIPGAREVWLLPSGNRTDKRIAVSPSEQLAMLKLIVAQEFDADTRLKIIDTELQRNIATETYDTYKELLRDYPETDFWFVYGSDSYATIRQWLNGEWLACNLPVLLVPRNSVPLPATQKHIKHLTALSKKAAPLSSTRVRQAAAAKKDVGQFVPAVIANYVQTRALFQEI